MNERPPQPSENPESSHIDQEFSSASSRWFNGYKEKLLSLKHDDGSKEDEGTENFAFYQDDLQKQLRDLGSPKLLERGIQQDGTIEKYGRQEAKSMHVAEAMSVLGGKMASVGKWQHELNNPTSYSDKEILASAIKEGGEAKKLFFSAAEKVFTPSKITDTKEEISSVVQAYELAVKGADNYPLYLAQFDFEHLNKSIDNPAELKKELANTIETLGEKLADAVFTLVSVANETQPEEENKIRLALAAGNKILYRLAKAQEKLGQ